MLWSQAGPHLHPTLLHASCTALGKSHTQPVSLSLKWDINFNSQSFQGLELI